MTFSPSIEEPITLPKTGSWPKTRHCFDEPSIWAVRAALASGRPLLLRGEPGIGKCQLARAVAAFFEVPFLCHVVDERTERDDLLYHYDAVSRLAQAQMAAIDFKNDEADCGKWQDALNETCFIWPGVLWWAFNWKSANDHAENCYFRKNRSKPELVSKDGGKAAPCGSVVLIDEIDKADPSVPNGLLESLANEGFSTPQLECAVSLEEGTPPPLVMITTNEERELPAAFLRRCLVLNMPFPDDSEVRDFLFERATVHWSDSEMGEELQELLREQVIPKLLKHRQAAEDLGMVKPGAAEFLDIVRVLLELYPGDVGQQKEAFEKVMDFAFLKNRRDR